MNDTSVSRHTVYRAVVNGVPRVVFNAERAAELSDEGETVTARVVSA